MQSFKQNREQLFIFITRKKIGLYEDPEFELPLIFNLATGGEEKAEALTVGWLILTELGGWEATLLKQKAPQWTRAITQGNHYSTTALTHSLGSLISVLFSLNHQKIKYFWNYASIRNNGVCVLALEWTKTELLSAAG